MNIAIVGNKPPDHDCSELIDSADLVVRISKMDHLDSGMIGKRTDVLYLEPNHFWWSFSRVVRRLPLLRIIPQVYIRESKWAMSGEDLLETGILTPAQVYIIPEPFEGCTTLALAVHSIHVRYPSAKLRLACADVGEARRRLFGAHVMGGEVEYMETLIKSGVMQCI